MMQGIAKLKYLTMSPRKIRRVVNLIRGKSVEEALAILKFTHKAAADPVAKTIQSATANVLAIEGTSRLKAEDLSIARINVDGGPQAKRIEFRAMGRANRYKHRFAHLTVVVEGVPGEEAPRKKQAAGRKAAKAAKADSETTVRKSSKKSAPKRAAATRGKGRTAGKKMAKKEKE
jgi:large subunit ribosomal protein L22